MKFSTGLLFEKTKKEVKKSKAIPSPIGHGEKSLGSSTPICAAVQNTL
ncbi:hypothetical protein [Runella rosea]|nr:hypothetical protein [Runella rosea]